MDLQENLSDDTFTVSNGGAGTLSYAVASNQTWLTPTPLGGTSTGEADTITISYAVGGLAVGDHTATVSVMDAGSAPAALNSPQTIAVTVTVNTVLPDFDKDGDVDVEDFGRLQMCLTDSGVVVVPSECQHSNMNGDTLVDQSDLNILLGCLSKPGMLADKTCDDAVQ